MSYAAIFVVVLIIVGRMIGLSAGPRNFSHLQSSGSTHPSVQWVPGVKWPGREADQSRYSAKVTNPRSYTSTPPQVFLASCLIKYYYHHHHQG
jgi:hypothetical protein